MPDDNTQLERLRDAVERLSAPGDIDIRSAADDLMEIAKAAGSLTPAFRQRQTFIPWLVLAEMGRVIDRAGDAIDARMAAVTLERDIPELRERLRDL